MRLWPRALAAVGGALAVSLVGAVLWGVASALQVSAVTVTLDEAQQTIAALSDSLDVERKQAAEAAAALEQQRRILPARAPSGPRSPGAATRRTAVAREVVRLVPANGVVLPAIGRITSGFSLGRLHPILRVRRPHRGVDISAPSGTPITAPAAGRVRMAGWKGLDEGYVVEIEHDNGVVTRYLHCRKALHVTVGQQVTAGQRIADVGSTGLVSGAHLHFEVLVAGREVDPLTYAFGAVRRAADEDTGVGEERERPEPSGTPELPDRRQR
jgi:murein DD-endopeptidase MepM/ murein hydrolase activator NlpD